MTSNKSIVYWASPYELMAFPNSAINMATNNLVKTKLILDKLLDNFINSGDKVGVKVHVGEAYNTRYLRHDYVREVVDAIKAKGGNPTLIETQNLGMKIHPINLSEDYKICVMRRKTTSEHQKTANLHGYSEAIIGAPLKFIDGEKGIDAKIVEIDGIHFKDVSVGTGLFEFDKMVVISHFKGHMQAGFGGAIKQLGIGCIAKLGKYRVHYNGDLSINIKRCNISKCAQECIKACPVNAIKLEGEHAVIDPSACVGCTACLESCPVKKAINRIFNLDVKSVPERVCDNAIAVINSFGPEKIRYINFAFDVVAQCDCVATPSMPIIPDLGIFASSDPVAIDKACVDAEINAPGLPIMDKDGQWKEPIPIGVEKFKAVNPIIDTEWCFDAAVKNKLGNLDYELVKIS